MGNKKTQKIIVMLMIVIMVISTLMFGLSMII
ncbi:MAG: stressosome-associated protein Prli42 [Kurthia sp.]|nr:stressosome-associated protein Prli42 [Candidatus Kurthia equi]